MESTLNDKLKINDIVHGQMEFEPYFRDIIAREEFKRLHNIKQLGSAFMVYPQLVCTRYEHSLGVSYMANQLIDTLERNSKIKISLFHRKCVSIAGLLHDLGHGPFSHMWEHLMVVYFKEIYHHEDISSRMVDRLFRHVTNVFENAVEHDRGIKLIQSIIQGNLDDLKKQLGADMYLSEIISNKYSEIDVDRVDYILRDFFYAGNSIKNVDPGFRKFLENAQVIEGPDGIKHINYSVDDLPNIYDLFKNRIEMHKQLYQNSAVIASQILLCEFFKAADDNNFKFNGKLRLTEITKGSDLTAFIAFDDTVLDQIINQLTKTTGQYETLKHYIENKKQFRQLNTDEYNKLKGKYNDKNFRNYELSIEDPFKKFKIFLDRHLLYNRNNNRVVNDINEVKQKLKLNKNCALEENSHEVTFRYLVEN